MQYAALQSISAGCFCNFDFGITFAMVTFAFVPVAIGTIIALKYSIQRFNFYNHVASSDEIAERPAQILDNRVKGIRNDLKVSQ